MAGRRRDAVRRVMGRRQEELRTFTIVGLAGAPGSRIVVAGIVEGDVVAIEDELTGDGQSRRFCHRVQARSMKAAEAESQAYLTYLNSVFGGSVGV